MLEEMQLICLMILLIGHGALIRGCFKINQSIPDSTDRLGSKFDGISEVLEELADLIDEVAGGVKQTPLANPMVGGSIPEMITSLLMSKIAMPSNHGDPLTEEWPIHEVNKTTQNEAQDELNELSS